MKSKTQPERLLGGESPGAKQLMGGKSVSRKNLPQKKRKSKGGERVVGTPAEAKTGFPGLIPRTKEKKKKVRSRKRPGHGQASITKNGSKKSLYNTEGGGPSKTGPRGNAKG